MRKIKHILIATDFSACSEMAMQRAMDLAKSLHAKVTLLHVAKKTFAEKALTTAIPFMGKVLLTPKEHAMPILKKMAHHYSEPKVSVKYALLSGEHPARSILRYAKKFKSDLIVMGAHGEHSLHDWMVGTTAEYIARKTTIPVLIIKTMLSKPYQKILVPLDFSNASKDALQLGLALFPAAKWKILHVGDQEFEQLLKMTSDVSPKKLTLARQSIISMLSQKIQKFIQKIDKKTSKMEVDIQLGYPGMTILEEAKKTKQDLVIMGTEGHSERHYFWLGRTATRVLVDVDKDLLLVPPEKKRTSIK